VIIVVRDILLRSVLSCMVFHLVKGGGDLNQEEFEVLAGVEPTILHLKMSFRWYMLNLLRNITPSSNSVKVHLPLKLSLLIPVTMLLPKV
jgi:hypothetical protein